MSSLTLDLSEARRPTESHAVAIANAARGTGGIKHLMQGKSDTYEVNPYDIYVKPGWNSRDFALPENQQHVLDLAETIAARGVDIPLCGFTEGGTLYVTDGESRLRAVFHAINVLGAEIHTVPVRLEPRNSDETHRVLGQLVRNTGKPLTPLEKAVVVRKALDLGATEEEISRQTGLTVMRIQQLRELLELPEPVQQQVQSGMIAATEAVRVVREHGDAAPDIVERAARLSSENGGAKAGKATAKTLAAAAGESQKRKPGSAKGTFSVPDDFKEPDDFSSELESALKENADLRAQIEALSATDTGRTIAGLQAQNAALNGRNQQMTKELADLKRERDAHAKRLEKIRTLLDVEKNAEIEDALRALMQAAEDERAIRR